MNQPDNEALQPSFLSESQWAEQEVLDHFRQSIQGQLASLTHSEQLRYRQLVRQYAKALESVEREDKNIKDNFETFGVQEIRSQILAATGKDLDPRTTYIHTRYLYTPDRQQQFAQRLRRSPDTTDAIEVLPEPQAVIDERAPVAHVLSMSLWQAACMNFGFLAYYASFKSDSLVNASFINDSSGVDFRYAQSPERINTASLIPAQTFIDVARRLNLGAELKGRIDSAMSEGGHLHSLLRTCTKAHLQFCLMELYRTSGPDHAIRDIVKELSAALDGSSSNLRVRQIVMTIKFTATELLAGKGFHPVSGFLTASKPAPEDETDAHHVSIPLFQIKNRDTESVFSFFPGRPDGELRLHANQRVLIADFRAQLLKARAEKKMDWFKVHLTEALYKKLTAVVPEPKEAGSFKVMGVLPRIQRDWIAFDALGFKLLSPKTSLEEVILKFQSDLYVHRLRQLAVERSAQDWADIVSAISTLFEEVASLLLIPVPGATKGLGKAIRFLFIGVTAKGLYSALEQSSLGDNSGLAQTLVDALDMLITPIMNTTAGRLTHRRHAKLLHDMGQPRTYTRSDGSTDLWVSDPARFVLAQAAVTDNMKLDEQGIYRQAGHDYAFLEKDGHNYVVEVERNLNGTWRVIANTDPASFKPPMIWDTTYQRWQLALDDSPALTDVQLLRRMVHGMTSEAAHSVLTISAVSRAHLQQIWRGGPAPASLTDAVTRFQADAQLQRCADELSRYPQSLSLTERPLLALMTQLRYWPRETVLLVSDHDGVLSEMYGRFARNISTLQSLVIKRLDDGELSLSKSSFFKAFDSDFLSELIKHLMLPTDRLQMAQLLASQLNAHKAALFIALTLHKHQLPTGGSSNSLDLTKLPLEQLRKTPVFPLINTLRNLHPGLSQERCQELLRLYPMLENYKEHLDETLHRRNELHTYKLPEAIYQAVTRAVFSARLERMLDAAYYPRAFNPDADQWSQDLCTQIAKHRFSIDLVIVASADCVMDLSVPVYNDSQLLINDLGGGEYVAYDRRRHALMPTVSGPDSFFKALVAGFAELSRTRRLRSSNLLAVADWRKAVVDALNTLRTPDGFIDIKNPQVESYSRSDVKWWPDIWPDAKGIYTIDDVPGIVQDGNFYEVQSAADGLTNSIIDRTRFARAPVSVCGNDAGTWRHEFERPMEWQGHYLFWRLGHSAAGFDSNQITAILHVSNTTNEMLRRVHVNREKIPPLLTDTLQRFPRSTRIETSENQTDPSVEMIKRVFPGLSTSLAADLVRSANELEIKQMKNERVPLRLSQEARWYLREVRVNRAIEGFYLPALQNNDSVKLMMHCLANQPGWSTDVKVEVYEGDTFGSLISLLGLDNASVQLTVLKTAQGWQVFSAPDQDIKASDQDLFIALMAALPDCERNALGYNYAGGADLLKKQLALRAVENRDRVYEVLGMTAQRPWFKPPKRLADGRIGYLLSGRGAATDRFFADLESRRRYERIYPGSAGSESAQALQNMRTRGLDIAQELARLEAEARLLEQQLAEWVNHKPDIETHDVAARYHKYDMAMVLRNAWRKEVPPLTDREGRIVGYKLELANWRVPTLPVLTADFSHIHQLSMVNMRLGAGMGLGVEANLNQFLLSFRSLTSLKIEHCQLSSFPEAIGELSNLVELSLARSVMHLERTDQQVIAGLAHLQRLNLHGCILTGRFDVRTLPELRELNLSTTETVIWPEGVMQLAHLTDLDLSRNHIITVPQEVLNGSEAINRVTSLRENELTPAAIRQLQDYQARTGINFGLHLEANHPPRLAFDDLVWLDGFDADERQARYQQCQLLREEPRASHFFELIDDLKTTADFELVKHDLVRRVQRMLKAVAEGERVRGSLFDLAAKPRACCDSAALLFSRLEVQVLVSKALADDDPNRAELSLARIIRGEFRLKVLDSFAVEEGGRRSGPVDTLEIGFTYRLNLTDALQLPAQPKNMKFPNLGFVEPDVIEQARVAILAMDNSEPMLDYMAHDPMWGEFLRAQYADQFDALYEASHKVVRGDDVYDSERYERELQALQNRLTLDALAKLDSN